MSRVLRPDAKPWAPRGGFRAGTPQDAPFLVTPPPLPCVAASTDPNSAPPQSSTAAKLFVGQLPFESDEKRLHDLFSAYGTVEHIHILRDVNNRSKGAAFVTYSNVEEADTAIFTLHNRYKMLANRMLQVSYAKDSPQHFPSLVPTLRWRCTR
ncbi:RNA-binding protein [Trypanosoma conorhini]|uniref:RNA-binding protein n=1 Tax=Trypanosoma conorhini TaxID=83891 RepID=A0A422NL41_9TRYP|nr:RNA-binding protein [Trypanosoma conorhini]RNF06059.1 RNA-binding protein [Trypanosoma conorhini]